MHHIIKKLCTAAAVAVLGSFQAASAGILTLDFDDLAPTGLNFGESVSSKGFSVTAAYGEGFGQAAVGAQDCVILGCPVDNTSGAAYGINDGGLKFRLDNGATFDLLRFDYSFIFPGMVDFVPGYLILDVLFSDGTMTQLSGELNPSDPDGFFRYVLADLGAGLSGISELGVFACTFDASNACNNANQSFSQFAIDNMVFRVPVPASLPLVGAAVGALAFVRRRR